MELILGGWNTAHYLLVLSKCTGFSKTLYPGVKWQAQVSVLHLVLPSRSATFHGATPLTTFVALLLPHSKLIRFLARSQKTTACQRDWLCITWALLLSRSTLSYFAFFHGHTPISISVVRCFEKSKWYAARFHWFGASFFTSKRNVVLLSQLALCNNFKRVLSLGWVRCIQIEKAYCFCILVTTAMHCGIEHKGKA